MNNNTYTTILTNLENKVLTITINRADKLNALNKQVMDELKLVFDEVYTNDEIRVVILTGSGEKAFAAGADIAELATLQPNQAEAISEKVHALYHQIEHCPKPVIAAVNGFALGGGCELAMSCHIRLASSHAKFGQPEVNLGLIPGYGGTQRLIQFIGKGRALHVLLTANMITAETALQYGLVSDVYSSEELMTKTVELANQLAAKSPNAMAKIIKTVQACWNEEVNGFALETNEFGKCFQTFDMKEGVQAFLEKRKADFTNGKIED